MPYILIEICPDFLQSFQENAGIMPTMLLWDLYPGVKRRGREADHVHLAPKSRMMGSTSIPPFVIMV
jgi:hypothetical protein